MTLVGSETVSQWKSQLGSATHFYHQ